MMLRHTKSALSRVRSLHTVRRAPVGLRSTSHADSPILSFASQSRVAREGSYDFVNGMRKSIFLH